MSEMDIPRSLNESEWPARGKWRFVRHGSSIIVALSCPECGNVASLCHHDISPNGFVSPDVLCRSCEFSSSIYLELYEPLNS